jgi:hemoglobin-like flavoprotein
LLQLVGQQFLVSIETVMKDSWTPDVEQAWATFLQFITYVMREAMIM